MQNVRIDPVVRKHVSEDVAVQERQTRVHLFTNSKLEDPRATFAGIGKQDFSAINGSAQGQSQGQKKTAAELDDNVSIKLKDGSLLELPRLTQEQYQEINEILSKVTPEERERMIHSGRVLGRAAYGEVAAGRANGPYSLEATQAAMSHEEYMVNHGPSNEERAFSGAILLGLNGIETDLRDFFNEVGEKQKITNELKTDLSELDQILADMEDGETETFDYREVVFNDDGTVSVVEHKNVEMSKDEILNLRNNIENQINSLMSLTERDTTELQMKVNKWQQATSTVSNILKVSHETMKGIIDKLRA